MKFNPNKLINLINSLPVVFFAFVWPIALLSGQVLPGSVQHVAQPSTSWNHQLSSSAAAPASFPMTSHKKLPRESINLPPTESGAALGSDYFLQHDQESQKLGCSQSTCGGSLCGACDQNDCLCRYLKVFGGWNFQEDVDALFGTANIPGTLDFNNGWVIGTAIGSYVAPDLRRELEFTYRDNTGNSLIDGGAMIGDLNGRIQAFSIMGNMIRDFRRRPGGTVPYVGGGLGVAIVDADLSWMGDTFSITDAAFAYQAFAGVQRQLSHRMSVFVEYRFFGTTDLDIESAVGTTRQPYNAHNALLGIQMMR